MTVQPRLAATVMLIRDDAVQQDIEVFMVRRVVQSEFMPNVYVFPGGSISHDDLLAEQTAEICASISPLVADPQGRTLLGSGVRAAAIREMFEEANVLLAYQEQKMLAVTAESVARFAQYRQLFNQRAGSLVALARAEQLKLATDLLVYFAHWITPELMPKRYDTHFFLAAAPSEQEALYDDLETSDGLWIIPRVALQRYARGDFPIAFPTFHQLRDLSAFASVAAALQACEMRSVPTYMPNVTSVDGAFYVSLPQDPDHLWKV